MRRAAAGLRSEPIRRAGPYARGGRGAISQHSLWRRGAPAGGAAVAGRSAGRAQARRRLGGVAGLRHTARPGTHRRERLPGGRRAAKRQPARPGTRTPTTRQHRFGQPLRGSRLRRRGLRRRGGARLGVVQGPARHHHPHRLARAGLSGVRRFHQGHAARHAAIRHRHPRPAVVLRPAEFPRRRANISAP